MRQNLFADNYADRAAGFRPSPVRSVWDVSTAPGMISLAGGNPDLRGLPLGQLGAAAGRLVAEQGLDSLQYGAGAGLQELRVAVTELMAEAGIDADAEDVLITPGSQMGLELVTAMFCNPGDIILAEAPTYVGAISTFVGLEAEVMHVDCDDDGLIPEVLEARIERLRGEGRAIKFLYTIPNFNNPSGVRLTAERRERIARICSDAGIIIVEDDPYGLISFDEQAVPAIRSFDENVIYLGSMSKIFSPGIRVGWVVAPAEVRARLQLLSEAMVIHPSVLSQYLALEYLTKFDWRATLGRSIERYRERADALLNALETIDGVLPKGSSWTTPRGGFFVWATLPEGYSADDLFALAVEEKVVFISGSAFFADGSGERNLRFSFSLESPENIREGMERLARASRRLTSRG
ncbi:PLP-dependent aminotransferase family protein [Leucobacter insecticola]|uniref:PLP-dependent aminotransferase family protein n=1 Tax=Leucobacter insecticola TaxID=2714934 RepID=A0A6G8FHZ7_9MICO|nr:PLP-dependent aminotransferase family protein [Leucobacter insecticola]QIM15987.1 PLP-dependent aminotransferase family protein [Leucobacter insecticola]